MKARELKKWRKKRELDKQNRLADDEKRESDADYLTDHLFNLSGEVHELWVSDGEKRIVIKTE